MIMSQSQPTSHGYLLWVDLCWQRCGALPTVWKVLFFQFWLRFYGWLQLFCVLNICFYLFVFDSEAGQLLQERKVGISEGQVPLQSLTLRAYTGILCRLQVTEYAREDLRKSTEREL